jgi:Domain of unknown function (DUF4287)/Domain of unknown function (DUF5655)
MSFQAYINSIKAKTGKDPEDFLELARAKGLLSPGTKAGQIVAWLKEDFGLGRGHAMAIVMTLQSASQPKPSRDERIARHFSGPRASWKPTYEQLLTKVTAFGPGVAAAPTDSYISLLRKGKKFGVLQVTKDRLDVGIKLKGAATGGRLEPAGDWNSMVTHRVRVTDPAQADAELVGWLRDAYEKS